MASNENKSTIKTNFSIDHILNHAGERFKSCNNNSKYEMISSSSSGDEESCDSGEKKYFDNLYLRNEKFIEIPAFNWLNYTRYNMPRLPSKLKYKNKLKNIQINNVMFMK